MVNNLLIVIICLDSCIGSSDIAFAITGDDPVIRQTCLDVDPDKLLELPTV